MTLQEFYQEVNGNYNAAMERFRSEERIRKYLHALACDPCYDRMCEAVETDDQEQAFEAAHMFKGILANFDLDALYQADCDFVEQLREKGKPIDRKMFAHVQREYHKVKEAIAKLES